MRKYLERIPDWAKWTIIGIESATLLKYGGMALAEEANIPKTPSIEHKVGKTLHIPKGSYKDRNGKLVIPVNIELYDLENDETSEVSLQKLKWLCTYKPGEINNPVSTKAYTLPLKLEGNFYIIGVRLGGEGYLVPPGYTLFPTLTAEEVCDMANGKRMKVEIMGLEKEDEAVINSTWPPQPSLKTIKRIEADILVKDYAHK